MIILIILLFAGTIALAVAAFLPRRESLQPSAPSAPVEPAKPVAQEADPQVISAPDSTLLDYQVNSLKSELGNAQLQCQGLEGDLRQSKQREAQLEQEIVKLKQAYASSGKQEGWEAQNKSLLEKSKSLEDQAGLLMKEIENKNKLLEELKKNVQELQGSEVQGAEELSKQLLERDSLIKSLEETIEQQNLEFKNRISIIEKEYKELENKLRVKEKELGRAGTSPVSPPPDYEEIKKERDALKEKLQTLEAERDRLQQEEMLLQSRISEKDLAIEQLEKNKGASPGEYEALQQRLAEKEKELTDLKAKKMVSQEEYDALKKDFAARQAEMEGLKKSEKVLPEDYLEIKNRLEEAEKVLRLLHGAG